MTTESARRFFLWAFLAFVVMLCVIGYSMAEAFNLSPYTFKLRSKTTAADSLYIKGDTLYMNQMAVSLAAVLKAVAVQTDTLRGSSTVVGIVDDTLIVDTDSTGSDVTIRFGRWGAGLRWHRATDALQFSNDFSTWTAIGTGGSSTTNADSLDGIVAHVRPTTDGYYLRYDADGDSLYLAAVTGSTDEDSIFVAHKSSRWMPLPDSTPQYIGETTGSTMMDFSRADTILAFIGIYYGEGVADSMLMSKGWIESIVGDSVSGKLDGINSSNGISGSASQGTANIQLDPAHFNVGGDSVVIFDNNAGKLIFDVFGTPTNTNEMTITENNIEIRSAGSNGVMVLSGYDVERVSFGALGTMFVGAGVSTAPTFTSIHSILDTLFAVRDEINDSLQAHWAAWVADAPVPVWDSLNNHLDTLEALYSRIDTTSAKIPTATLADSAVKYDTANVLNWTEVRAEIKNGAEIYNKIDTTNAKIPTASLADSCVKYDTTNTLNWTEVRAEIKNGAEIYNKIDTTSAKIPTASVADAVIVNSVDSSHIIANAIDSLHILNASISDDDLRDTIVTTGKLKNGAVTAAKVDSSITLIVANMRTPARSEGTIKSNRFASTDTESTTYINGGQGIQVGSSITLGTDITDDTLVVDYYPEYTDAVLADLIIPTWKDSIDIYGYVDTVAGMGNTMYFNDSTLTSGLHRRGMQLTIKHPMRVDSLRYIIVQGLVKDSSATNTMWLKGMLRTSTFRAANVDSNAAGTIKDYDSLGGDYGDVASVRQFVLSGGAITEGSPWYLLLIARHGSGTAWNWAQVGRIRAVYSRTRL